MRLIIRNERATLNDSTLRFRSEKRHTGSRRNTSALRAARTGSERDLKLPGAALPTSVGDLSPGLRQRILHQASE